ncbi:lytic transglycosylase domain-containing protein [Saccharopolyspora endophytica]|uniref:Lytic transglycosylase domain-containing protein n=1 Tax=Saccharopolyspora endophytica TaxID=543886 RepID=A0ABS5DB74_9PSEU|nr:lytic transglycosylase domain-containing protein [Saccharopolyspora endophytica]MBQ0923544.1 lytic transglycosylase domain-containing protein [Saccharopolyspora endophytica]
MWCYQAAALVGMLALSAADQTSWVGESNVEATGSNAARPMPQNPTEPPLPVAGPHAAVLTSGGQALKSSAGPTAPKYGIPATVLDSYLRAVDVQQRENPGCRIAWSLLAGIGKVESGHARGGDVTSDGDLIHPIYGPSLNGTNNTASIPGEGGWARAAGSMQFIPSSWERWGADGNHDGATDPQNVYDASLAASRYLCAGGRDLSTPGDLRAAIFSYNHSGDYVNLVLRWMSAYETGGGGVPDQHASSDLLQLAAFDSDSNAGSDSSSPETAPPPPPPAAEQPQDPEPPQDDNGGEPAPAPPPAPEPEPEVPVLAPVREVLPPPVNESLAPVVKPVEQVVGAAPLPNILGDGR